MHSFLSKKLRRSFDLAMKRVFPDFHKTKVPGWPSVPMYRRAVDGLGDAYVSLEIDPRNNAYTVELAWAPSGVAPGSGTLEFSLEEMHGPVSRGRPSSTDGRSEYYWNVVTGGEGLRADVPEDDWSVEAMVRSAAVKPDPDMGEHVDAAVEDTMRMLSKMLPSFIERARVELAGAAKSR